jgi:hypothetical protein
MVLLQKMKKYRRDGNSVAAGVRRAIDYRD